MIDLTFTVIGARADRYAAAPQLVLRVRVTDGSGAKIAAIALRVQVMLEVARRRYDVSEGELLAELFGPPARYGDTLKPMLWTHASHMVLEFSGQTEFDLAIPCSYDFEVAAHKYLAALAAGSIPINLLFSGMVFVEGDHGATPEFVPWNCEARYALPHEVWQQTMDAFFPNSAWLRINRDLFNELRRVKIASGLPTWDAALERLCELAKVKP